MFKSRLYALSTVAIAIVFAPGFLGNIPFFVTGDAFAADLTLNIKTKCKCISYEISSTAKQTDDPVYGKYVTYCYKKFQESQLVEAVDDSGVVVTMGKDFEEFKKLYEDEGYEWNKWAPTSAAYMYQSKPVCDDNSTPEQDPNCQCEAGVNPESEGSCNFSGSIGNLTYATHVYCNPNTPAAAGGGAGGSGAGAASTGGKFMGGGGKKLQLPPTTGGPDAVRKWIKDNIKIRGTGGQVEPLPLENDAKGTNKN